MNLKNQFVNIFFYVTTPAHRDNTNNGRELSVVKRMEGGEYIF